MKKLFFDVESAPLSIDQLTPIMPEFEAGANLVNPDKIKAAIEAKRESWLTDAALKPTTGRVIAISTALDDAPAEFHCSPDERTMLDILYRDLSDAVGFGARIVGWNLFGFDLPFFCARCAAHGIHAYKNFTVNYRGRWSWNEAFVDPMQIWTGPYQRSDGASLKAVAYALGLGLKTGNGKDFSELLKSDPIAAKSYSIMDINLLRGVVEKMGL